MKCKEFDNLLSDWLKGRLAADQAARMTAHAAACPACAEAESEERSLLHAWSAMPEVRAPRELWPLVEARLAESAPARVHRPVFGWRLSLAGVAAAAVLCAALLYPRPAARVSGPADPALRIDQASEQRTVITMVADLQQVPDPDKDTVAQEPVAQRVQHPDQILYGR